VDANSSVQWGNGTVEKIPVAWFGADGTGAVDATDAINQAIASVADGLPGIIFFEGTYDIDGTIDIDRNLITLQGGMKANLNHTPSDPNTDCISFTDEDDSSYTHFNAIKNMLIGSDTANSRHLIHLERQARFEMDSVYCNGSDKASVGLWINMGMFSDFYSCEFYDCNTSCLEIDQELTTTTTSFYSCVFESSDGWGAIVDKSSGTSFVNCTFESNTLGGLSTGQNASGSVIVDKCHFEANTSGLDIQAGNYGTTPYYDDIIIRDTFLLGSTRTYAMDFDNCVVHLSGLHISNAYYPFQYGANIKGITVVQGMTGDSNTSGVYGTRGPYTGPSAQEHLIHGIFPDMEFRAEDAIISGGLGSELITNGDFTTWTDSNKPDGWGLGGNDVNNYVEEDSGKVHFVNLDSTLNIYQQPAFTAGKLYRVSIDITTDSGGSIYISLGGSPKEGGKIGGANIDDAGQHIFYTIAGNADTYFRIIRGEVATDLVFDDVSLKEVASGDIKAFSVYIGENLHLGGEFSSGIQAFDPNDGTPSISGGTVWTTGDTTTITKFDDGNIGDIIILLASHSAKIVHDGTNFLLNGAADFDMENSDALILIKKGSSAWVEIARSDNTL